jgi:hypothetical protein
LKVKYEGFSAKRDMVFLIKKNINSDNIKKNAEYKPSSPPFSIKLSIGDLAQCAFESGKPKTLNNHCQLYPLQLLPS